MPSVAHLLAALALAGTLAAAQPARAQGQELPEYRLKAAVLYNFMVYTDWPADTGATLTLCMHGSDPFGAELDALQGKPVGERRLALQRKAGGDSLKACQVVFFAGASADALPRELARLRGLPVLTVADSPGAARAGAALNMAVHGGRIGFEANLQAARAAGLQLNAKLLRLASEVLQ